MVDHPDPRNHTPVLQLVTLGSMKPNLDPVNRRPLGGSKLTQSRKNATRARRIQYVWQVFFFREHFGRTGRETKRSTQNEPPNVIPATQ